MSSPSSPSSPVTGPADLRNVVLVGSAGSGKTTLFEALLRARIPGRRPDRSTAERPDAERSASLTLASVATGKVVVNLLDAPGHPDFVGELRAGLRAADAAVFVVSAADGIDTTTAALWQECRAVRMPRCIVITKLDLERTSPTMGRSDFDAAVASCLALGPGVVPAYVPLRDSAGRVIGTISLPTSRVHDYSTGAEQVREPDAAEADLLDAYRGTFLESVITESEDDDLMERYLEGEQLAVGSVRSDLLKAVAHASFFPVVPVVPAAGIGVEELFSVMENGFPDPSRHQLPDVTTEDGTDFVDAFCDPGAPLIAQVVRTTSDPFQGRRSMVRVFSGTLRTDDIVHVGGRRQVFTGQDDAAHPGHDEDERIGALAFPVGVELKRRDRAIAGDIVLVAKLAHAETTDTLSARERPALVAPWPPPEPMLPIAIRATRGDEDKLAAALARLTLEDTTVRVERSVETDQLIVWTMGQAHADLLLARLGERYGVKVTTEPVRVALRETFVTPVSGHGRHVKQTGGHGQYAVCDLRIEPLPRGTGTEFVDKVVGGAVPRQFIPSVEKGARAQLHRGTISGHPVVDVRITLLDGKAHSVDSSDMAFQEAAAQAVKEAATPETVALLEPVDDVTVTVGNAYLGSVMTDVSNRRGQLLGTDTGGDGVCVVHALVPESELTGYAIDLRGITRGTGAFTRAFHSYELVPEPVAEELLAK